MLNFPLRRLHEVQAPGIVVLRPGRNASRALLESLVRQALGAIERMHVDGQLWVVETGRLRIHQAEEGE